ncbi:MAG: host attachment protein [Verrucomicrobia bacterium]|nr:host attachment protein [Verrucomicrobiota bacterium]MBS0647472.1 host attachment protein [Verrucomicrobiota bacterium]
MRKVWVVVANQSEAKVFHSENGNTLIELTILKHDEGHKHPQDLVSDKQGSYRGSFGSDGLEPRTSIKEKEASIFARQLADYIEKGVNQHTFDRLYIVAKSPFVSLLRSALSSSATKLLQDDVHKDIVHATAQEIRDYLPPVL